MSYVPAASMSTFFEISKSTCILGRRQTILGLCFLMLVLGMPGSVHARPSTPSVEASHLVWPASEEGSQLLTISGPDGHRTFEVGPGQHPELGLFETSGELLPDGSYTWELWWRPSLSQTQHAELAEAQQRKDSARIEALIGHAFATSGTFRIENGEIQIPQPTERRAEKPFSPSPDKQVINDDLMVKGSTCGGDDCDSNETFGDTTLRLKESVLRIEFEDTDAGTNDPRTDWQLTANDSATNGAEYFAIEDLDAGHAPLKIEAGANDVALYVDDAGHIGFNTATPAKDLHLKATTSPTLRLEQTGTTQVWDVVANDSDLAFEDTTASTTPFGLATSAPDDSLYIASDGDIGMGTASPSAPLHIVRDDGTTRFLVEEQSNFVGGRVLFQLKNKGATKFNFENTNADVIWELSNNGDFNIVKAGTGQIEFAIDSSGNVEITGDFISNGTTLDVPDYVFAPGYELMPLGELQGFVERERHLPNVPPAHEIQNNGLRHADLQMRLLEKVEELTLYTLDQQETLERQHQLLEKQSELIRRLEGRLAELESGNPRE